MGETRSELQAGEAKEAGAEDEEARLDPLEEDPDAAADAAALQEAAKSGKAAPLAAQLRQGSRALACVVQMSGSITTELISQAGFELIIVDHENGPGDFGVVANLVRSALGAGSHAMLRLPEAEASLVSRALDAGAEGVLLPRVTCGEEAEAFVDLVAEARNRLRGDDAIEWTGEQQEEEDDDEEEVGKPSVDPAVPNASPPPPRPLVCVELDPSCDLDVAEAVLKVDGVDLVFLDPDRAIEILAAQHGSGQSHAPAQEQGSHAGDLAAGGVPQSPSSQDVAGAEAAAGQPAPTPHSAGAPAREEGQESPTSGAYPSSVEKGILPSVPQEPPPAFKRGNLALRAPLLGQRKRGAQVALPSKLQEELDRFWARFDALPALAAEQRKLVGCCAHSRTGACELLQAGHSVVVIAADTSLLREGAVRHTAEIKMTKAAQQRPLYFATPLESARARLASSALVAQLRRHKVAAGAFVHLGDPLATEQVALAGFEAIVLDHEQGPGDLLNAVTLIHAATSAGAHSLLRVPGQDAAYLRRALQLGVDGIILPGTETPQQAANFVALARRCWPTSSQRSGGGPVASVLRPSAGAASAQHLRRRGEELLLKACQIETEAGLAAVGDISRVEGLDMVFFAPVELAASVNRGSEVVVMDHARGPGDLLGAVGLVHAAAKAGAHAMIRVPAISHHHLRKALQIGVEGVILPHVENAQDAHSLVELCLYPARNYRDDQHAAEARLRNQPFRRMDFSFAPPLVEFYGQRVAEFTRRQGEAVLIAAQVDTALGAQNVREIAQVPGIDMIFVDATRLSGSDVERSEQAAKSANKLLGGMLVPGCTADDMFRAGYRLVCAASDEGLLAAGARACIRSKQSISQI